MYTAENFRYTQAVGWVVTVRESDALLSYSIKMSDLDAMKCRNFKEACDVQKTLPFDPRWGDVFDISDTESELWDRELSNALTWAAEQAKKNESASREYVERMTEHAEWLDHLAMQEDARY